MTVTQLPNWVDLIVVTIVLRTCYNGLIRGVWSESLKICGLVLSTAIAINYYAPLTQWLMPWLSFGPRVNAFVIFCVLFLTLTFATSVGVRTAAKVLQWERVHWLIQGIGLMLGAVRGLWWAGLIMIILTSSGIPYFKDSVMCRGISGARLEPIARQTIGWVVTRFPGAADRSALIPRMR